MNNISNTTTNNIKGEVAMKSLVRRVHEVEAAKLGFSDLEVEFTTEGQYMANCQYMIYKSLFTISGVDRAHKISYNIVAIQRLVDGMFFTKRARRIAAQYVVLHIVRHELRHAWQTVHNKQILMGNTFSSGLMDSMDGYGARPEEADANTYAEDANVGKYNIVLKACTHNQNMASKMRFTREEVIKTKSLTKELFKLNASLLIKGGR